MTHLLLKNSSMNHEVLKHFRSMSNLSFLSKVIEKVISAQLIYHLHMHDLLALMQSACRAAHSSKTAMCKIHNDIVHAI